MFELEKEIGNWKQAFSSDTAVSSEEAVELESHLRESISTLLERGLSEQEAFMVGANRLGHPTALQQEYAKNNLTARWRYRLFWMLTGLLGFKAVGSAVSMVVSITGAAMAYGGLGGSVAGATMILVTVLLWICVLAIVYRKRQSLGWSSESLPLSWVVALGVLLISAPVVNAFGRVAQSRLAATSWLGEAALYSSIGGVALNLCIVAICFTALCMLNDREALTLD